jgi:hypothetical protein
MRVGVEIIKAEIRISSLKLVRWLKTNAQKWFKRLVGDESI